MRHSMTAAIVAALFAASPVLGASTAAPATGTTTTGTTTGGTVTTPDSGMGKGAPAMAAPMKKKHHAPKKKHHAKHAAMAKPLPMTDTGIGKGGGN